MKNQKKLAKVFNLEEFGLTVSSLKRLGGRLVRVTADFRYPEPTPALVILTPKERAAAVSRILNRKLERLRKRWPDLKPSGNKRRPTGAELSVSAKEVCLLSMCPDVVRIWIREVKGLQRSILSATRELDWYAVRARVAIEVEDQTQSLQTLEDRIVLVKALSFKDAVQRLRAEWVRYSRTYFNPDMHMVRWHLEEIVDVYSLMESEIDPGGTEVYSSLAQKRRMRPQFEWHPGREARTKAERRRTAR